MNEKLIEFIKKNLDVGNDIEKIKQALINAGHDIKIVEEHITHITRLIEFVNKHVNLGHDIDKIKQALLNAGYDIKIVEEHIANVIKAKKNKRYVLIASITIIILIISFVGFYYFTNLLKKTELTINESKYDEIKYQKSLELFNKALISNDISACDEIEDENLKDECQSKFLINISNETIERVSNESFAGKEILNKAIITHNASICIEIEDDSIKMACEQILKK